jgi:hypothetical protein
LVVASLGVDAICAMLARQIPRFAAKANNPITILLKGDLVMVVQPGCKRDARTWPNLKADKNPPLLLSLTRVTREELTATVGFRTPSHKNLTVASGHSDRVQISVRCAPPPSCRLLAFRAAVNADIPNSSVRKSGMLKIIEVWEGRWEMLVR